MATASQPRGARPAVAVVLATPADLPQLGAPHGANLFDPKARHVTVSARGGGGAIDIVRLPSVQISLTLAVSPAEFFGDGIVFNLATLLGIEPLDRI